MEWLGHQLVRPDFLIVPGKGKIWGTTRQLILLKNQPDDGTMSPDTL